MVSRSGIFDFWAEAKPGDHVHPRDRVVFDKLGKRHGFDLRCLPGNYLGPLRTAPIVLLYLSPGFSTYDLELARTSPGRRLIAEQRKGFSALPSEEQHALVFRWWCSRTACFGSTDRMHDKVAVLNIGAYHSRNFNDWGLLAALPSSRITLDWAQSVLFPEALRGKRVVICLRSSRYWGLEENRKFGRSLFAPKVTRGGHMKHGAIRNAAIIAANKALNIS